MSPADVGGVPGTIPGLLRRGSPVLHVAGPGATGAVDTCVGDKQLAGVLLHFAGWVPGDRVFLDLDHDAGRDRAVRWLATGERCPRVHLSYDCPDCRNTDWRRPAHDARWMRDGEQGITAEQSAALLAWSVRSVAAGGAPIEDLLRSWPDYGSSAGKLNEGRDGRYPGSSAWVEVPAPYRSWRILRRGMQVAGGGGHATLAEGRAKADAAALLHGFALLDRDGTLTLPDLPAPPAPEPSDV